jgi:hypothetical protein
MRPRLVYVLLLCAALGAALLAVPDMRAQLRQLGGRARAAAGVPAGPQYRVILRIPEGGVTAPAGLKFFGWALFDRKTGQLIGHSDNAGTGTNYTESMIKVWIAADYLTRVTKAGNKPTQKDLTKLRSMIIHSDDDIAQDYWIADGRESVITRLNQTCGTHAGTHERRRWAATTMTPDDAARYGLCVADGRAAGAYTEQVLGWMREVTGAVGDGWEPENDTHDWHVNCLAILHDYVLTVMVRYPWTASNIPPGTDWGHQFLYFDNLETGADACKAVATQLVTVPVQ